MKKKEFLKKQVKNYNPKKIILFSLFILTLLFLFFVCQSNERINEQTFVNLYADLLVTKEFYRDNDTQYFHARDSLYKLYNVNQFRVEQTLKYYQSDVERWDNFFKKVVKKLEENPTTIKLPE